MKPLALTLLLLSCKPLPQHGESCDCATELGAIYRDKTGYPLIVCTSYLPWGFGTETCCEWRSVSRTAECRGSIENDRPGAPLDH